MRDEDVERVGARLLGDALRPAEEVEKVAQKGGVADPYSHGRSARDAYPAYRQTGTPRFDPNEGAPTPSTRAWVAAGARLCTGLIERVANLVVDRRLRWPSGALVEEIDTDAVQGLPDPDVELDLQARLLLMKGMGQFDHDRSVLGRFGSAFLSGQKENETVRKPGFAQPQANRH